MKKSRSYSRFICRRCEVPVGQWAKEDGFIWKHHGTAHTRSCGKSPLVVERTVYEKEMEAFAKDCEAIVAQLFDKKT